MLSVEALSKKIDTFAMRDVTFGIDEGDYFVLLGASGVGKTVLLENLTGLMTPEAGRIMLDGEDITHARIQNRKLALVYQDQALFPHMTVARNIGYGVGRADRRDRNAVRRFAENVGGADLLDRYPATLSGGEAQRVALARALATRPRLLLLDEPLSSLDMQARGQMRALLRALHRAGQTVLHVTHDFEEAVSLATRVGIMEHGTITQLGAPRDVFQHPRTEFVARFVGIRNVIKGRLENADAHDGLRRFSANGMAFAVLSDARLGPGLLILRSEDITVARTYAASSAQNSFRGKITDIAPARLGVEVTMDIGVEMAAWVTAESVANLGLHCGDEVWMSFKAAAARFVEE